MAFHAKLAVDHNDGYPLVKQPGSDGFSLLSTPLFQVMWMMIFYWMKTPTCSLGVQLLLESHRLFHFAWFCILLFHLFFNLIGSSGSRVVHPHHLHGSFT